MKPRRRRHVGCPPVREAKLSSLQPLRSFPALLFSSTLVVRCGFYGRFGRRGLGHDALSVVCRPSVHCRQPVVCASLRYSRFSPSRRVRASATHHAIPSNLFAGPARQLSSLALSVVLPCSSPIVCRPWPPSNLLPPCHPSMLLLPAAPAPCPGSTSSIWLPHSDANPTRPLSQPSIHSPAVRPLGPVSRPHT